METQERKGIYERMLGDFQEDVGYRKESGFCHWLISNVNVGEKDKFPECNINSYPELLKHKPPSAIYGTYWWDVSPNSGGRTRRIEVLKRAIKDCNKQLRK